MLNYKESIMDDLIKQLAAKLVGKGTDCMCYVEKRADCTCI